MPAGPRSGTRPGRMSEVPDLYVSIQPLLDLHGLSSEDREDRVQLTPKMSGIEDDPRNDWLHVALAELRRFRRDRGQRIDRAAFVGSANGVDAIAALRLFRIGALVVTDILEEILPTIERNIRRNTAADDLPGELQLVSGRDCEPVPDGCDLIYANLPLVMTSGSELTTDLATTTLTDSRAYESLAEGPDDPLVKWSLLPQLGFLLSAKRKLKPSGAVITLLGGRIPDSVIEECFRRAGMTFERGTLAVMRQSDPDYVEQYANYEATISEGNFLFYDEGVAGQILQGQGHGYPAIVDVPADMLRDMLEPAALTAAEAWDRILAGWHVGHLSYGFRASPAA